jgi:hypothetical protein
MRESDDLDREVIAAVYDIRERVEVIRFRLGQFDVDLSRVPKPKSVVPTTASKWPRTYR